jgi:hypothetical protein
VYKDWWVFFLSLEAMKWFSFKKRCFTQTIQFILPDFTLITEIMLGQLICIREKNALFKVDIETERRDARDPEATFRTSTISIYPGVRRCPLLGGTINSQLWPEPV